MGTNIRKFLGRTIFSRDEEVRAVSTADFLAGVLIAAALMWTAAMRVLAG
jgi:hypothetical protein